MQRYPENITADIETFRRSDWKGALSSLKREGYSDMWPALSSAARVAIEKGNASEGKVLWILADACSMVLNPNSVNEPFKPFMVGAGKRSAIPIDLQKEDILLLSEISLEVDDPWLQARLADLVWLLKQPRDVKYALLAIDAYRAISLDTETWIFGGRECWQRAIILARLLRSGSGERLKQIESAILTVFDKTTKKDAFFPLWLSDLMHENGLGRETSEHIANKLETLGQELNTDGDLFRSREYLSAAAKWFMKAGDDRKWLEMSILVAEGWVKEAKVRIAADRPSHMVAAMFYENAIQVYRTIPRNKRSEYKVDERIAELHRSMSEAGEKSLDEMGPPKSASVDISRIILDAQNAIRGKPAIEALAALAKIAGTQKVNHLREFAEKMLKDHPLQGLFSRTHYSSDGRVIGKSPGFTSSDENSEYNQKAIWIQMINQYQIAIGIAVQGEIIPALEIMNIEHRLQEVDFISICANSPIVPPGRERLFGKAMFYGYERDFSTAIHLLVPQIENMVRFHLKNAGVKTTTLDQYGIETENGLSALIDLPEVAQIFGEDLAFEIKVLFCDSFGPNLRNELAHGLLGDLESQSIYCAYAWWLGLKLSFQTFWNKRRREQSETAHPDSPDNFAK
jgi:hypothetical protein